MVEPLSKEQIENNKQRFINIVNSINREGMNKQGLLDKLEKSDFYTAPASTQFHGCYEGGLCQHCLNVYDNLVKMVDAKFQTQLSDSTGTSYVYNGMAIDSESIKIVALFHDFSKMNFYESYLINKKIYSNNGSKYDNQGRYDWVSVSAYKVKDQSERFIFGTHGQNSEYMTGSYIPLKVEESAAIIWHMGTFENQNLSADVSNVYNRYPLAALLHTADVLTTYLDEKI